MGLCAAKLRTPVRELESETLNAGYNSSLHYLVLQPGHSGFVEEFLLYFSNKDIGKLDLSISEKSLRHVFHQRLASFYKHKSITCLGEFRMIVNRKISVMIINAFNLSISKLIIFCLWIFF